MQLLGIVPLLQMIGQSHSHTLIWMDETRKFTYLLMWKFTRPNKFLFGLVEILENLARFGLYGLQMLKKKCICHTRQTRLAGNKTN